MIKKRIILLLLVGIGLSASIDLTAQETRTKKFEFDVSLSPYATRMWPRKTGKERYRVLTADLAVRYVFNAHFSAGLGLMPTFIDLAGEDDFYYVPFCFSFRYDAASGQMISPYFLLNVGGSFLQSFDPVFQVRFALGADVQISDKYSIFAEFGYAGIDVGPWKVWAPLLVGIRF